ncbi:hypothetical protein HWV62_9825 [Athelia sp. TMB]|nr:hypothetical protein HWV62_9825 [Athelia sp. TMB]
MRENPSGAYSQTRMDSAWAFRQAYAEGRKIKDAQDAYCAKAEAGAWNDIGEFPESLQWESIVDVLRGKVKGSADVIKAVDLDMIVRLSNEFKFPVASFHHAGQTYLVPNLLKKTWVRPTIKKREAYRNSEFAPRILSNHGIPVVMKSDHPVVNSRYLLNEATMAHYYGLPDALALASVTSTPAAALGLGHRIGSIREDIVIWDSHPLSLGATPQQVYVDGLAQLNQPSVSPKSRPSQSLPTPPDFDAEAAAVIRYNGLPPLEPRKLERRRDVMFTNVNSIFFRPTNEENGDIELLEHAGASEEWETVVVRNGTIICNGSGSRCREGSEDDVEIVDLQGGSLSPGLITYGSPIGLVEMRLEPTTNDGMVLNPLVADPPSIFGPHPLICAIDGLQFGGRNMLHVPPNPICVKNMLTLVSYHRLAYRGGVTTAVTAPSGDFVRGLSTAFAVGAVNVLEKGAVVHREVALHMSIKRGGFASVSTQITALRHMLLGADSSFINTIETAARLQKVSTISDSDPRVLIIYQGTTLVIEVENADIMATLLSLKAEYEAASGSTLRLTFSGAAEAHLVAKEIAAAGASVILSPARAYPEKWDERRMLPGPPISRETAVTVLMKAGVNVAIGVVHEYTARNLRFDLAWTALESHGRISKIQAVALATSNLERALGMPVYSRQDIVAYRGGDLFDLSSKVVAVLSADRGTVDLFE